MYIINQLSRMHAYAHRCKYVSEAPPLSLRGCTHTHTHIHTHTSACAKAREEMMNPRDDDERVRLLHVQPGAPPEQNSGASQHERVERSVIVITLATMNE
eukprot:GHVU01191006.1.p1 GENE.GHVU01191006.1~~GHVU01191006.1.p1  ORF type:complete len:100 (+),score=9.86 GHVU01191006.1:540-839(+)